MIDGFSLSSLNLKASCAAAVTGAKRSPTTIIAGAIVAEVGGRRITRQLFPTLNFASSQPAEVRFGLGDATKVDRLTIHWPSGHTQTLSDVPVGMHARITEGADGFKVLY